MCTRACAIHVCAHIPASCMSCMYVHKPFQLTAFGGKELYKYRMFEEAHAKQGSATDTATEHAIRSTATEHAFSASGIKDSRLQNMFREACSNAPSQVQRLLQNVDTLGHYPRRYKKPADKAEKTSDSLAKKLSEAKKLFTLPFKNIWTQCKPLAPQLQPPALLQSMRITRRR